MAAGFPETPISLDEGICLKSYEGSYYNLRYLPSLRDIGVSCFVLFCGRGGRTMGVGFKTFAVLLV